MRFHKVCGFVLRTWAYGARRLISRKKWGLIAIDKNQKNSEVNKETI